VKCGTWKKLGEDEVEPPSLIRRGMELREISGSLSLGSLPPRVRTRSLIRRDVALGDIDGQRVGVGRHHWHRDDGHGGLI
jgi:hypothetical protein